MTASFDASVEFKIHLEPMSDYAKSNTERRQWSQRFYCDIGYDLASNMDGVLGSLMAMFTLDFCSYLIPGVFTLRNKMYEFIQSNHNTGRGRKNSVCMRIPSSTHQRSGISLPRVL